MSKKRKAWNETMKQMSAQSGASATGSRRTSSRIATVSRDLRVVDDATREEVRNARLDALEADNYAEEQATAEDAYVEEDDDEEQEHGSSSAKGKRGRKSKARAKAKMKTMQSVEPGHRWKKRKYKSLRQVVFEQGYDASGESGVNYSSVAMTPSVFPSRKFCSVCGYFGFFKCPRCGMRYCRKRCQETHKETRCLKFGT